MSRSRVCCVIPAYRARESVCNVVRDALPYVDWVIVVDDACPHGSGTAVRQSFSTQDSVRVITRDKNGGVGAAMKTGIEEALGLGADIIVKIDADGQMDPSYIPGIVELFENDPTLAYVKGNRFFDPIVLSRMPAVRLLGNSCLSLLAKFASGFWNILDPTNGYLAFSGRILPAVSWRNFANSYFFEMSVLCEFGLKRAAIAELAMEPIYAGEQSSLSISRSLFSFPPKLWWLFLRRIILQYYLFDINLGSLYILFGLLLAGFGTGFAAFEWWQSIVTGIPRTTGTVMLGVLPVLMGFQLILNALLFDVQFSARSSREMLAVRPRRSESYGQIVKMRERTSCFDDGVSKPLEKLERFEEDQ
ncbi:MAG TPA: glycosyltransferase family 2 protein [Xanthobacteraceae bacterium]